ncbi:MAG: glutathionylspermidine synthase family protein [bacterium]|nr:glutathionylspermidine synthase family protein [Betaproteobacteria bacterium]
MRRERCAPRAGWQERCEAVGFTFHSEDGGYWDESACYAFTADQVDVLEAATEAVHRCCLDAVDHVVSTGAFDRFQVPDFARPLVTESWKRGEPSLFGRFDFSWDGRGQPKMLEYNADTPTSLVEAAVVQWYWLQDMFPGRDQFNSLHEKLVERWRAMALPTVLTLACTMQNDEDADNLQYLLDTALQAGLDARAIDVEAIGWQPGQATPAGAAGGAGTGDAAGCFVDLDGRPIRTLFKLYPWEWMLREEFGPCIPGCGTMFIEPPWKMLLSNKAILPVLWELFPGHPNLLAASFDPQGLEGGGGGWASSHVKKPLYSREGANVTIRSAQGDHHEGGIYGAEGYIYQAYAPLPRFDDRYPVIGSWIVGDRAAGMGIREDRSPITRNSSRFIPHWFD